MIFGGDLKFLESDGDDLFGCIGVFESVSECGDERCKPTLHGGEGAVVDRNESAQDAFFTIRHGLK